MFATHKLVTHMLIAPGSTILSSTIPHAHHHAMLMSLMNSPQNYFTTSVVHAVLSVRFEVVVSLLLAPVGADKRGPKAPFPLVEIVGNTAGDLQESTRRSSGGSQVLLKALLTCTSC